MPGIVGIIGPAPDDECQRLVNEMLQTMQHEPRYVSGTHFAPSVGAYGGWVSHRNSFAASQSSVRGEGGEALLFAGECFALTNCGAEKNDSTITALAGADLLNRYHDRGPSFIADLNGLFSGFLIDQRRQRALLFNDRYGSERLYHVEKRGTTYFASEAKALLRILPELRAFDDEGVAQFLRYGSTLNGRTLFRGIRALPGGTLLSIERGLTRSQRRYFVPESWELQPPLDEAEFESQFREAFLRALPAYFSSDVPIGISITGGLDTRMIVACMPAIARAPIGYTFGGQTNKTLDARIGAQVAQTKGLDHYLLRIGADFVTNFGRYVDQTVWITDGCAGALGAHEIYLTALARKISPIRLTGNYGSEVLRGMSTFKAMHLASELFARSFRPMLDAMEDGSAPAPVHPVTHAAFREVPWHLFGTLAAGRSQVVFRTPYLDNEIVRLAYRAPGRLRLSAMPALRLIHRQDPALASIPTDQGLVWDKRGPLAIARRLFCRATFKLDYLHKEGLPDWLGPYDVLLDALARTNLLGLHKFLPYRSWFRRELSDYARAVLTDPQTARQPYWNAQVLPALIDDHVRGRHNRVRELNAVLTLEAVERLLVRNSVRVAEETKRVVQPKST